MKAAIFALALIATPAVADECLAYRAQMENALAMLKEVSQASRAALVLYSTADIDQGLKQDLTEQFKRMSQAVKDYNAATERTMKGVAAACYR